MWRTSLIIWKDYQIQQLHHWKLIGFIYSSSKIETNKLWNYIINDLSHNSFPCVIQQQQKTYSGILAEALTISDPWCIGSWVNLSLRILVCSDKSLSRLQSNHYRLCYSLHSQLWVVRYMAALQQEYYMQQSCPLRDTLIVQIWVVFPWSTEYFLRLS